MPYPKRLLNPGEQIAFDLHPHWWYFSRLAAWAILILAAAVAIPQLLHDKAQTYALFIDGGALVIWVVWFLVRLAEWRTTHFVLTNDRLVVRAGVVSKEGREIPLERINDLSYHQSLFERLVGAGDLMIESAGQRGQDTFDSIPHPDRAQQEIYTQIENNRQRTSGVHVEQPQELSIPEQIAQLARLRDQGDVTDAEFQAKKADLLKRM